MQIASQCLNANQIPNLDHCCAMRRMNRWAIYFPSKRRGRSCSRRVGRRRGAHSTHPLVVWSETFQHLQCQFNPAINLCDTVVPGRCNKWVWQNRKPSAPRPSVACRTVESCGTAKSPRRSSAGSGTGGRIWNYTSQENDIIQLLYM